MTNCDSEKDIKDTEPTTGPETTTELSNGRGKDE